MLVLLLRVFEHVLVGVCLTSLSLLIFSIVALFRLLPGTFKFVNFCLRWFLILSFRFYKLILTRMNAILEPYIPIDLLSICPRIVACVCLSLLIAVSIIFLANLQLTWWSVAIPVIHGLIVSLAWDEFTEPGGLQLGVKSQ
jgi:hypothetical protein